MTQVIKYNIFNYNADTPFGRVANPIYVKHHTMGAHLLNVVVPIQLFVNVAYNRLKDWVTGQTRGSAVTQYYQV